MVQLALVGGDVSVPIHPSHYCGYSSDSDSGSAPPVVGGGCVGSGFHFGCFPVVVVVVCIHHQHSPPHQSMVVGGHRLFDGGPPLRLVLEMVVDLVVVVSP